MNVLPAKVTAGEPIVCCNGHEVARVVQTLSLAQSIMTEAVSMVPGAVKEETPERMVCSACNRPVVKLVRGVRWSVRLSRGWVS